ncbi:hypothetical protein L210DRAFT_2069178 [Boletus edulis BED1]|uniref:Uncharacterized protein n=1 Tax=Boletus edulis BED1 TaxID=1328754 RepID=A0AAD4BVS6_BOLED|nr:hypothetical protein L210DRAFT_2069178 [Boletus edulis BED1]
MVASGQRTMTEAVPPPPNAIVRDHHKPVAEGTISDLPHGLSTRGGAVQSAQANSSVAGKEAVAKHRPESLEFIPQSVIRRYPSAGHCFGHRPFSPGHDYQFPLAPPHVFVNNPAMLLEGTWPRATYTTLEGPWRASFFTEIHPTRQFMGGQAFVIETAPVEQESTSLSKRPAMHELSPLRKRPTHRRRLGVPARAALRDCSSTARRRRNDGNDGSSTSDSDSDFESNSEYSTRSSADESILPRILGADLIAAIDANSEPDMNLVASRRTKRTPLNLYEDFLISEDSTADISMVMQVSSYDDASGGEVIAPAFRPLTHEDIQQWASGVVQKCVRQVCRSHVHAEPSSPSQASDVCAERPSGSGVSQCPLSGLHCKSGAAALTDIPAPKTEELPVSLPPTSVHPSQKPLQVRNLQDIPEFVPRQGYVSMITGRVEGPGRFNTRTTVDNARDAAARVIARMENQAGFNTRQFVGTEEKRMVNTAGGRQGTLRCA